MKLTNEWSMKTLFTDCLNPEYTLTHLSGRHYESDYRFHKPGFASGQIHSFITPGMELSKMEIEIENDLVVHGDDHIERYVSTFVTRGTINSRFDEINGRTLQTGMTHLFTHVAARDSEHQILAGKNTIVYINLKPEFLLNLLPEWDAVSRKINWENQGERFHLSHAADIRRNTRLQQLLADFSEERFSGATRGLLFEAKAMELLATQLDELDADTGRMDYEISKADREKLVALHDYISLNFLEPFPMNQMARQFLLNEFKIKKGFKHLYGETAFGYLQRLRLEKAHELLLAGDISVGEASDLTGYSSVHNFSNAFLKKYGYRPGLVARTVMA